MLHLPMTALRHLALREPTSSRNAFFPGAPGLIMRGNPRRMTSLQNSTLQVPWNHILTQNTRGGVSARTNFGPAATPRPRCLQCLPPPLESRMTLTVGGVATRLVWKLISRRSCILHLPCGHCSSTRIAGGPPRRTNIISEYLE
jgi:hypothetical protein